MAACQEILQEAGLEIDMHAYGTNIEGDWDEVMQAIKRCHEVLHEMGVPRINTSLKVGTRVDRMQSMAQKVDSVEQKMVDVSD